MVCPSKLCCALLLGVLGALAARVEVEQTLRGPWAERFSTLVKGYELSSEKFAAQLTGEKKVLGKGHFGEVYSSELSGQPVAVKSTGLSREAGLCECEVGFRLHQWFQEQQPAAKNAVEFLAYHVNEPNDQNEESIELAMPLLSGKELQYFMGDPRAVSEVNGAGDVGYTLSTPHPDFKSMAALLGIPLKGAVPGKDEKLAVVKSVTRQLLTGVGQLQAMKVQHHDINVKNIMVVNTANKQTESIVIVDYGAAHIMDSGVDREVCAKGYAPEELPNYLSEALAADMADAGRVVLEMGLAASGKVDNIQNPLGLLVISLFAEADSHGREKQKAETRLKEAKEKLQPHLDKLNQFVTTIRDKFPTLAADKKSKVGCVNTESAAAKLLSKSQAKELATMNTPCETTSKGMNTLRASVRMQKTKLEKLTAKEVNGYMLGRTQELLGDFLDSTGENVLGEQGRDLAYRMIVGRADALATHGLNVDPDTPIPDHLDAGTALSHDFLLG